MGSAALFGDAEISGLMSDAAFLARMLAVEAALARAEAAEGLIPADAAARIADRLPALRPDPQMLARGTAEAGLSVPALVGWARGALGADGRWLHYGATSQDVIDTAMCLALRDVLAALEIRLVRLSAALAAAARAHAATPMAARTRTQIATPTTFGLRVAGWLGPLARQGERLADLRPRALRVQLGGASGTGAAFGGRTAALTLRMAAALGLAAPLKPWQTERDGIVEAMGWLALTTICCGRIGADLAILARSEIAEVAIAGGGSSTMPQKANPTAAEALVALARHAAGLTPTAYAAALHGEERDLSAWALEWLALGPLAVGCGAALRLAEQAVAALRVDADRMAGTIAATRGTLHAEALAFRLAPAIGLEAAQAAVKAALADMGPGETLAQALWRREPAAPPPAEFDDPLAHVGEAARMVADALAAAGYGEETT